MDLRSINERLLALSTAALCDADKAVSGGLRVVDPAIKPICPGTKFLGLAHTVTCFEDFLTVIKGLKEAGPGDVLVVDARGSKRAVAGGLFPVEAKRKGLAGIVIDGPCRDTADIRELGFPYYARSVSCYAGTTNRLFDTQVSVTCGGVVVDPGDLVFGDDDGIIVATADQFEALLDQAEAIARAEKALLARMLGGDSLLSMTNFDEHCRAIATGGGGSIKFIVE